MANGNRRRYIVETHVGEYPTVAATAGRAIANVRWRIYGSRCNVSTIYWKARPV